MKNLHSPQLFFIVAIILALDVLAMDQPTLRFGAYALRGTEHEAMTVRFVLPDIMSEEPQKSFALFEGHGGSRASTKLATKMNWSLPEWCVSDDDVLHAFTVAFDTGSQWISNIDNQSSTALVVDVSDHAVFIANAGSSKAVVFADDDKAQSAYAESDQHLLKNEEEIRRIKEAGGTIEGIKDILGSSFLSSRILGQCPLIPGLIDLPQVIKIDRKKYRVKLIVVATQSVWEQVRPEEVREEIYKHQLLRSTLEYTAKKLVELSHAKNPDVDHAAIVIEFVQE